MFFDNFKFAFPFDSGISKGLGARGSETTRLARFNLQMGPTAPHSQNNTRIKSRRQGTIWRLYVAKVRVGRWIRINQDLLLQGGLVHTGSLLDRRADAIGCSPHDSTTHEQKRQHRTGMRCSNAVFAYGASTWPHAASVDPAKVASISLMT